MIFFQCGSCLNTHLQSLFRRAAGLLLQLARLQSLDVLITLFITIIQKVLFGLQQTLARCYIANADREATVGWNWRLKKKAKQNRLIQHIFTWSRNHLLVKQAIVIYSERWTGAVFSASEYYMYVMDWNPEEHLQRYTGASLASRDMAFAASSCPQSLRRM